MTNLAQTLSKMLVPLSRKIASIVSRGSVTGVNDSYNCQNLQVTLTTDEVHDEIEYMQTYGFTAVPLTEAECVFLSVGGSRSHGIVISTPDRRYRPKNLAAGDVCLWIAETNGERVFIEKASGIVNLGAKAAFDFVALAAKVKDELDKVKIDLGNVKSVFDLHTHPYTDTPIGPATTLATLTPITAAHTPASVAATKVKAT